jgi:ParB family transcriptional regulator, chromosome partitioning protein
MRRRGGLGRGLEALIPSSSQSDGEQAPNRSGGEETQNTGRSPAIARGSLAGATLIDAPLDRVDPNPRQPREAFDEEALQELAASIEAVGVLQPIVVRPVNDRFQIVMGERRLRAAKLANLVTIPAVVRLTEEDSLLRDALIENIHREDLNPLEEAAAYEQLLADFDVTHEELAARIGRSRSGITNALRLLKAAPSVQRRIAAGTLSAGHARAVMKLLDHEQQERLADRIVAEGLTVRQAEELASRLSGEAIGPTEPEAERRARSRAVPQAPGIAELADRLSDRLDTRVKVQIGKRKGKVLIEFATLDDLQRICDVIGLASTDSDDEVGATRPESDADRPLETRPAGTSMAVVPNDTPSSTLSPAVGLSAPPS